MRFASLDVHPNVDYAFHALALDEWRSSFGPTLWNRAPGNDHTELRQVWFPGSHSNVGGGFEDQQIATIALACKCNFGSRRPCGQNLTIADLHQGWRTSSRR
ncbi:DUF2235 domain-containing protein [Candidatus Bathyarchaeota archaeon]|nr:DUF2235 domain-containing protein [Candidatus Bathyarchaeota archaeon]